VLDVIREMNLNRSEAGKETNTGLSYCSSREGEDAEVPDLTAVKPRNRGPSPGTGKRRICVKSFLIESIPLCYLMFNKMVYSVFSTLVSWLHVSAFTKAFQANVSYREVHSVCTYIMGYRL
jgi:hypothetical protein